VGANEAAELAEKRKVLGATLDECVSLFVSQVGGGDGEWARDWMPGLETPAPRHAPVPFGPLHLLFPLLPRLVECLPLCLPPSALEQVAALKEREVASARSAVRCQQANRGALQARYCPELGSAVA